MISGPEGPETPVNGGSGRNPLLPDLLNKQKHRDAGRGACELRCGTSLN